MAITRLLTKPVRPRMVTTIIHAVDWAKVDGMPQGKCSATNAKAMETWLKSARAQRCLEEGDKQAPAPSMQGLNAYAQGFVPVQYPISVPQSAVPQQVPQYVRSNMAPIQQAGLPTAPVSQDGPGMMHTAPAQQQPLN